MQWHDLLGACDTGFSFFVVPEHLRVRCFRVCHVRFLVIGVYQRSCAERARLRMASQQLVKCLRVLRF
jgi:hypothetical protein